MALAHPHYHHHDDHRFKVVDGMRAVGIAMIVWYHLWLQTWLTGPLDLIPSVGYLGVDILLYISGFGLFYPYAKHIFEKTPVPSLKSYISHRIFRIIPSYYLALFIAFFVFSAEKASFAQNPLWHLFSHLTFLHAFFIPTIGSISTVFWTLGTEAQFYILFPVLAWLALKNPWVVIVLMIITSYVFRIWALDFFPDKIEFMLRQMPAFLDIYATGMLTALIIVCLQNFASKIKWLSLISTLLAFIFLVGFFFLLKHLSAASLIADNGRFVWLSYNRLFLGLLLSGLVVSFTFSYSALRFIFTNKLMMFISVISYNLYLWHYLIILELKQFGFSNQGNRLYFFLIALLLSVVIAAITTFLFERPIIKRVFRQPG